MGERGERGQRGQRGENEYKQVLVQPLLGFDYKTSLICTNFKAQLPGYQWPEPLQMPSTGKERIPKIAYWSPPMYYQKW